jgi:AcrR family transcriptional regulator
MVKGGVLDAAAKLMCAHGYRAMTMRQLASALGIQAGSLYNHVQSKEELLWEIVRIVGQAFLAAAENARRETDPIHRLCVLVEGHIGVIADRFDWSHVFVEEWKELSPYYREQVLSMRRAYEQAWQEAVAEGIRSGVFAVPADSVGLTVKFLLGALNWMHQWYRPDGPLAPAEMVHVFSTLALAAVGAQVRPRES